MIYQHDEFASMIVDRLERHGMTQTELSARLGISTARLNHYLRGRCSFEKAEVQELFLNVFGETLPVNTLQPARIDNPTPRVPLSIS